ncbi:MAG: MMPL family transporter [Flavobacteriales bacterium]|nr:MMPL family transporter [Flavobacteriales bacterium]MBK6881815.1 MMPL family transporter [Flavobacteriales bacterium]MBK7113266.1 MMPL family transporter [Flavobacteriales bacterium]MBK7482731.1 MMPL family transporter [Flavobacteriales bacterium]MBK8530632.1 MMPL family transporter [Flavobacteriales bacterium]
MVLALVTGLMAWEMTKVKVSYKFGGLLPKTDSAYVNYQVLQSKFSEDGNVIVLGVKDPGLYQLENFREWYRLGVELKDLTGVDSVFSEAHLYDLVRNDSLKRFTLQPLLVREPASQAQVDSLIARVHALPFYKGLLYNEASGASLMMVFVNADRFNSEDRGDMVDRIQERVDQFAEGRFKVYHSGLPFIRTVVTERTKTELRMFVGLMVLTVAFLIFLFFRSWRVMFVCLTVVVVAVVWALGSIGLLGYKLTSVMAVIPPLIIVIGIPNCIFLINKFHNEFAAHGNSVKALSRVIQRVGNASFITNATTAVGFATFMLTYSDVLKQFGVIASLNIMAVFLLSILLVPILFSFLKDPEPKHLAHLDRKWVDKATASLIHIVQYRRPAVYTGALLLVVVGLIGASRLKNESHVVDDLPADDPVMKDLAFFEQEFNGVMPLEVMVDTRKKGHALKDATLKRIDKLQQKMDAHPELSRSLSIADAVKYTRQAFYGGDSARYGLLTSTDKTFMAPYVDASQSSGGLVKAFMDEERQSTRITTQVADMGTAKMDVFMATLRAEVDSIFDPAKYKVILSGTSVVFLEGSKYMVQNLMISLVMALVLIAGLMALLFNSARMVLVSLVPNIIPLIATAGLMGYLEIPIKPSTLLVFSIALGIAVDDAIHYLSKYRYELKTSNHNIKTSVLAAIHESGVSMIYTSVVLFCGFSLFVFSDFGGTQALGLLVSFTLLVAMFTNLLILPSLLLSFENVMTTRSFDEPLLDIMDEEEDIDLSELQLETKEEGTV